jgi:hypothetical protein
MKGALGDHLLYLGPKSFRTLWEGRFFRLVVDHFDEPLTVPLTECISAEASRLIHSCWLSYLILGTENSQVCVEYSQPFRTCY